MVKGKKKKKVIWKYMYIKVWENVDLNIIIYLFNLKRLIYYSMCCYEGLFYCNYV